jgi:hypothetical protein
VLLQLVFRRVLLRVLQRVSLQSVSVLFMFFNVCLWGLCWVDVYRLYRAGFGGIAAFWGAFWWPARIPSHYLSGGRCPSIFWSGAPHLLIC